MLLVNDDQLIVGIAKAMGCDSRLEILKMCRKIAMPFSKIARELGLAISTVSQHIDILHAAGLVEVNILPYKHSTVKVVSVLHDEVCFQIMEDEELGAEDLPYMQEE